MAEPGLRRTYKTAVEGLTRIDGFDNWAIKLVEFGSLHNHTRMWFATAWAPRGYTRLRSTSGRYLQLEIIIRVLCRVTG